ncbi:MAG TPA: hypothetical protein VN030_11495 [Cellvibrio sp.]|nr:hypothetical protein [Cellvibrio sp.]
MDKNQPASSPKKTTIFSFIGGLISRYWLIVLAIVIGFGMVYGITYLRIYSEFEKAKVIVNGQIATSALPTYGQFGDAIGGVLNPILSFITVCLLVWSIRVQLYELSETREEIRKSAEALKEQANINKSEYDRKQLEDSCNYYFEQLSHLFKREVFSVFWGEPVYCLDDILQMPFTTENRLKEKLLQAIRQLPQEVRNSNDFESSLAIKSEVQLTLFGLLNCLELLVTQFIEVDALKNYWISRVENRFKMAANAGAINDQQMHLISIRLGGLRDENAMQTTNT